MEIPPSSNDAAEAEKAVFPSDEEALELFYLTLKNISRE
jgi:hypothetical protein